ncbi:MAG: hypothetical protein MJZ81_07700 [Bacteroidales bacterium]|nr:hypothetical protein [Bacteroidales bacterium]
MDIKTLNGNPIADTAARQTLTQKQDKISDIDDIRREASEGKQARITNEVNENRRKIVIPIKRNPIYPEVPSLYAFLYSSRLLDFPTYYNF